MPDSVQPAFQNWKLTLSYDGTGYHGWQIQPNEATVQGNLQAALGRICGEAPLPQGSGRTDAGVHALAQVASFVLKAAIPAQSLLFALNRTLPSSIRILEARTVRSTFHARHSAVAKTYEYRVFLERPDLGMDRSTPGRICPPFLAPYVYNSPWPMDLSAAQEAAEVFVGEHDFLSFAASDPDLTTRTLEAQAGHFGSGAELEVTPMTPTTVRRIFSSAWEQRETEFGPLLVYRVRGSGFLHHMVRNLVGTMLDVGRGHRRADQIPAMLMARSRSASGPTAPARGLFLHSVEYDGAE